MTLKVIFQLRNHFHFKVSREKKTISHSVCISTQKEFEAFMSTYLEFAIFKNSKENKQLLLKVKENILSNTLFSVTFIFVNNDYNKQLQIIRNFLDVVVFYSYKNSLFCRVFSYKLIGL